MNAATRRLTQLWLEKALDDLRLLDLVAHSPSGLREAAIYHCQQAAEKAVKAVLVYHEHEPPKTHDLELLISEASRHTPGLAQWMAAGIRLTPYATRFRYPGALSAPDPEEFEQAYADAQGMFRFVLSLLPEDVHPGRHEPSEP